MFGLTLMLLLSTGIHSSLSAPSCSTSYGLYTNATAYDGIVDTSAVPKTLFSSNGILPGLDLIENFVTAPVSNSSSLDIFVGPTSFQAQHLATVPSCDSPYVYGAATPTYTCRTLALVQLGGYIANGRPRIRMKNVCSEWCRSWSAPTRILIPDPIVDGHLHRYHSGTNTQSLPIMSFGINITLNEPLADLSSRTEGTICDTRDMTSPIVLLFVAVLLSFAPLVVTVVATSALIVAVTLLVVVTLLSFAFAALYWIKGHYLQISSFCIVSGAQRKEFESRDKAQQAEITNLQDAIKAGQKEIISLCTIIGTERKESESRGKVQQTEIAGLKGAVKAGQKKVINSASIITRLRTANTILVLTLQSESRSAQAQLRDSSLVTEEERRRRVSAEERASTSDARANEELVEGLRQIEQERALVASATGEHVEEMRILSEQLSFAQDERKRTKDELMAVKQVNNGLLSKIVKMQHELADVKVEPATAKSWVASQGSQLSIQTEPIQTISSELKTEGSRMAGPTATALHVDNAPLRRARREPTYEEIEREAERKNAIALARVERGFGTRSGQGNARNARAHHRPLAEAYPSSTPSSS
ncbi:hypothetical protein FRB93_000777 [Tulasnella sp. JGI-2019a]|nr:hypothetical protein FRB93_000777 [Tulasnella sp. JGI-2019a]